MRFGDSINKKNGDNSDNFSNQVSTLNQSLNEIGMLKRMRSKRVQIQTQVTNTEDHSDEIMATPNTIISNSEGIGMGAKIFIKTNNFYSHNKHKENIVTDGD